MTWLDEQWPEEHTMKVGWITGDVYCSACGRRQPWPCPHRKSELWQTLRQTRRHR